jgi:hypothetical protein
MRQAQRSERSATQAPSQCVSRNAQTASQQSGRPAWKSLAVAIRDFQFPESSDLPGHVKGLCGAIRRRLRLLPLIKGAYRRATGIIQVRAVLKAMPKILYFVPEDWAFVSHF